MDTTKDFITPSHRQQTVKKSFTCIGRGLHSGKKTVLSVLPAEVNTGIIFKRKDINGPRSEIQASWKNVKEHKCSVSISNALDVYVDSIEHIMAALYACDIDNAKILIDGPEIPILDGSAAIFVKLINQVGKVEQNAHRHAIIIKRPISVTDGDKFSAFLPSPITWIEVQSESNLNATDSNNLTAPIHPAIFESEFASARLFVYSEQIDDLNTQGLLRGRSLQNSVLIENGNVINKDGLRFDDEYIRHDYVNCLGDIALLGARLIGQFTGIHSDHEINFALMEKLINDKEAWGYSTVEKSQQYWARILKEQQQDNPLIQDFTSKFSHCMP